jgi:hypothetical protein
MTYRSRRLQRIEAMLAEQQHVRDMRDLEVLLLYVREKLRCFLAGEPLPPAPPEPATVMPEAEGARERLREKFDEIRRRLEIRGHQGDRIINFQQ